MLARHPAFCNLFRVLNNFFHASDFLNELQQSSKHAAVHYPKVCILFLEYFRYIGKSIKHFLNLLEALNVPPSEANTHCRLVSLDTFICPYAQSRSSFDIKLRVISTKIWFCSSSISGMCGLIMIDLSFKFLESSALSTDLPLFTIMITSDTKQSSSTSVFFRCPDLFTFSSSFPTFSCRCSGTAWVFCLPKCVWVSVV